MKSAIHALPAELLNRFIEAVELGDIKMLDEVISDIRVSDPVLAEALGLLANRFEYDKLLDLVQETVDERG